MSKSHVKKFREAWEDDEWGKDDSNSSKVKDKKYQRKKARKQKFSDRWYDDDMNIKRKK
tara:strand:- start:6770 stop:6946 length:177 start_codon:yes stop_codon:yes gene_type:complete